MTVSRISLLAALLIAWGAAAQTNDSDRAATAPPRSLSDVPQPYVGSPADKSGQDQPPAASDDDQQQDDAPPPPPRRRTREQPPDVDTSGLASDVPEDENGRTEDERQQTARPPSSTLQTSKAVSQAPSAQPPGTQVESAPLAPPEPPRQEIQVQTLGTVEGPPEGLLDQSNGGLGENMWSGAARSDIETLLPRLPLASSDTAVRGLSRRLILTKAEAPTGTIKRALLTIRIEKLMAAGFTDEAAALAASGSVKDDPDFARVQAEAILSAGRANDACGGATAARLNEGGQFWLQLRAYCAAAAGDGATAEITRNVLDAQQTGDAAYNVLSEDALTGAKKPPGAIAKPTAMHLFLLRKAGMSVPPDVARKLGLSAEILVMRDKQAKPDMRLAAAERVVRAGAATTAELKAVVDAQVIAPDKIASAAASAPKLSFLSGQVLLRRAAQLESRPPVKAQLVHQALVLGDKAGMFEVAAKLQADVAATLDPKAASGDPLIGWSLLLAGKPDSAGRWLGEASVAVAVLDLVAGKEDQAQAALSDIAKQLNADPKPSAANDPFEALILGSYDALGLAMPADAKRAAKTASAKHWPGRRPDGDAMQKIVQAASEPDRKGEAVLRILDVVGGAGPRDLAPDVTIECVRALSGMGMNDAARALAVHALLLYRPS
ncbi:MAG: hypothetical protein JOZ72_04200 [Alphaproteobacteria bacterium]|nr:hypothetical protein [Alphaproteobacteria bacterium]